MTGRTGAWALPGLALTASLGVLLCAVADDIARRGGAAADPLFWASLVVIVGPLAARLAAASPSRAERIGLLLVLAAALYLVKVVHSPTSFTFHDELGHLRGTADILATDHLFAENPVVGAYAVYPGSQILVAALARLGDVSAFSAGLLVVGVLRLALLPALFGLFEEVSGSSRLAGMGALLYAANPNFLYFDAQFAYESIALPLAALATLAALRRARTGERAPAVPWVVAVLVVLAVVVTHHVTSYALFAFLLAVAILVVARTTTRAAWRRPLTLAVVAGVAIGAWLFVAGERTGGELLPVVGNGARALVDLVTGGGGQGGGIKKPFQSSGAATDSDLARALGFASVAFALLGLALALRLLARRRPLNPLQIVMALAALLYPATLALRLTAAGTETSNRASEFVFVGLGYLLALVALWALEQREGGVRGTLAFVAVTCVLVTGGLIVGWPPYDRLPGRYAPGAGSRSIDPVSLAGAAWFARTIPRGSVVAGDAANTLLMTAYGAARLQRGYVGGVPVSTVFASPRFGRREREIVLADRIRYLLVDRRLVGRLPLSDRYFEGGDPTEFPPPLSRRAVDKWPRVPGLDRILDSGALQVYDASRLLRRARGE